MRIYVDKGAIRTNERLYKTAEDEHLEAPIVVEEQGFHIGHGFRVELRDQRTGGVVAQFVYDPSKLGGVTSVWCEVGERIDVSIRADRDACEDRR